jgi:hypothetical protein
MLNVRVVVVIHHRVPEVQLEAIAEVGVLGAARQLLQRVVLERADAAETDQTARYCATWAAVQSLSAISFCRSFSTFRVGCPKM